VVYSSNFVKINQVNKHKPTTNHRLMWELSAAILSFVLMILATLTSGLSISPWFWGIAFLVGGFFKAVEGITKTIEEKALNVEFLMIAAALAAFTTGDFPEGAILIFIFAVSGVLEQFATAQTEKALTSLLKVAPKTAILLQGKDESIVSIADLKISDIVIVKPGQQVPADGVVHVGGASLDQSSITGEFNPVEKVVGDSVFAGSICIDSTMQVRVTKDPSQSVVQKMIDLVKRAQEEKTKSEKRISLFEKIYVYFVILLSLFIIFATPWFGWLSTDEAFRRGVIVLVVASPCALVASITPALLSTLSHAANKGILIKSGRYIEMLRHINVVAFDKTGTLTTGKPKVIAAYFASKLDEERYLPIVVNAERSSNHPLAKAISKHFHQTAPIQLVIKELPGRGLEVAHQGLTIHIGKFPMDIPPTFQPSYAKIIKDGKSTVNIVMNQQMIGFIALQDTVREEAKIAIKELVELNIQPVMLTGDKEETARAIAATMQITKVHANCLPEDKVKVISEYKTANHQVLMIGDGINDAPSLATATIGVSMGDGTDVSLETADIIMMNNNLRNVPYLVKLSKRTQVIITQNVIFSISVIFLLLVSNIFGLIILRLGVLGHELSTILVILNSLRLLSTRSNKRGK
jgi:Cd2+/Zn2+-exporting ATPase